MVFQDKLSLRTGLYMSYKELAKCDSHKRLNNNEKYWAKD